jgi:hypothetical protein
MQDPFFRHHMKKPQINLYKTYIKDTDVLFKCKTVTEHANKVHCGFLTYLWNSFKFNIASKFLKCEELK